MNGRKFACYRIENIHFDVDFISLENAILYTGSSFNRM